MKPQILIAVDFDMTIVDSHPFPTIKGFRRGAKKYINKLSKEGYFIIIWTCRTNSVYCSDASEACRFLYQNDVKFNLFNDNHPALKKAFKNDCRKISVDIYIDDKGLWPFGFPSWFWLYWMIKLKSFLLPVNKRILSHCKPEHFE